MVFIILSFVVGCADDDRRAAGLGLAGPEFVWEENELVARTGLDVSLSTAAMEALENGVALTLTVQTRVQREDRLFDRRVNVRNHRLEIRYLPLSRHYQLANEKRQTQQSFPRLWMLLAALKEPIPFKTQLTRADFADGEWQVRMRAFFDISRLPPPMRLPAWFSNEWRSGTGWHDWVGE